jgi:transposase
VQQCCQHVIRRCRAVTKLGPGGLQSWAADVIEILREAHRTVEDALARGDPALDEQLLAKLRERYDEAVAFGITHNRLRDWHEGNHPGYTLGCWLRDYKEQVWLFTREFCVEWTNNCSEQAIKAAKRHQAVSGYWHTPRTLARWCRIRSYLDSAANHGLTALDAITRARPAIRGFRLNQPETRAHNPPLNGHLRSRSASCSLVVAMVHTFRYRVQSWVGSGVTTPDSVTGLPA